MCVCVCVYVHECVHRRGCGSEGTSYVNSVGCEWVAGRSINVLRREIFTSSRTLSFEISFKTTKKKVYEYKEVFEIKNQRQFILQKYLAPTLCCYF